jgi:BirA family transcriptional regulator, biotin operon repressor / biotin---[acetyl-CoA-carboxylase] ligase
MSRAPASWSDPRLAGTRFHDVRWFDVVDSTNHYLLECAADGAREGIVAVADEQTAGRGRLGRTWVAPPGSALLVSVLLRPKLPPERLHLLTLATALAVIDVLQGVDARLKWPNDVVVDDDRKLAGILAEADGAGAMVIGMGLNVRSEGLAPEVRDTAAAYDVDRRELLVAWLCRLHTRLDALDDTVPDAIARSATLGRHVRVELARETFEGTARALTDEGYLVVNDRIVTAGDVIHLRAD